VTAALPVRLFVEYWQSRAVAQLRDEPLLVRNKLAGDPVKRLVGFSDCLRELE